jgi:ParB-like chromosome segregation protein Spo0J
MKRKKMLTEQEIDNIFARFGFWRESTMPVEIEITRLKPHPRNVLIYGQEDVSDLVAQIKERGRIVIPLIINKNNTILSGHRRWGAAKELGIATVPCEMREFDSDEDELEFLLHSNVSRKKTREQTAREGIVLEEVLSAQAKKRRMANLSQNNSEWDESSHSDKDDANDDSPAVDDAIGRTRDEVAKALRIGSGKQFDRMKAVINKVDELRTQGRDEDAELFLVVLNRSASAAYDLLSISLDSLTNEKRDSLKLGKVAPRALASEEKEKPDKTRQANPYGSALKNIKQMEATITEISSELARVKGNKQKEKIFERIKKQIVTLRDLLPSSELADNEENLES